MSIVFIVRDSNSKSLACLTARIYGSNRLLSLDGQRSAKVIIDCKYKNGYYSREDPTLFTKLDTNVEINL